MKELERKKKIRSLAWGYFLKRKVKEITLIIGIIFAVVFLPYLIGRISNSIFPSWTTGFCWLNEVGIDCVINKGTMWGVGFIELIILSLVFLVLYAWLNNNWEKAEEKAEEELIKTRRKK